MAGDFVEKRQEGGTLLLTLNRPERRNALGSEMVAALVAALVAADADPAVGAVVITGAAPAFCAGSDLKELAGLTPRQMRVHEAATAALARAIALTDRPVLAAVEGYALGGGCILAASCDLVIAARNARWHLPEVSNGWLPPWGLAALVARLGPVRARRLTWGLAPVEGVEAEQLGLVDQLVEPGEALPAARELASRLGSLPANAVADVKSFYRQFLAGEAERLDVDSGRAFEAAVDGAAARALFARFTTAR